MTRHTRCGNVGWCDLRIDGIGRPYAAVGQRDGEAVPEPLISQNIREFSRETLFRRFLESHVGKPFADFPKGRLQTGMTLQGFNQRRACLSQITLRPGCPSVVDKGISCRLVNIIALLDL